MITEWDTRIKAPRKFKEAQGLELSRDAKICQFHGVYEARATKVKAPKQVGRPVLRTLASSSKRKVKA